MILLSDNLHSVLTHLYTKIYINYVWKKTIGWLWKGKEDNSETFPCLGSKKFKEKIMDNFEFILCYPP